MYKITAIPIKIPTNYFMEADKLILNFTWKNKHARRVRKQPGTLKKRNYK